MSCGACGRKYEGLMPAQIGLPALAEQMPLSQITQGPSDGFWITSPKESTASPVSNGPGYPEEVLVKPENTNE